MRVHEVRWDKGGRLNARDYNLFYGKGNEIHQMGKRYFVHHRLVSAVKRVYLDSDRRSCKVLRDRWYNVTVLKVQAPSEEDDDSKDSFYEELQ